MESDTISITAIQFDTQSVQVGMPFPHVEDGFMQVKEDRQFLPELESALTALSASKKTKNP